MPENKIYFIVFNENSGMKGKYVKVLAPNNFAAYELTIGSYPSTWYGQIQEEPDLTGLSRHEILEYKNVKTSLQELDEKINN